MMATWRRAQATGTPVVDDIAIVSIFLTQALTTAQIMAGTAAAIVVATIFASIVNAAVVVAVIALLMRPVIPIISIMSTVAMLGDSAPANGHAQSDKC
jgi:hypothetical protein